MEFWGYYRVLRKNYRTVLIVTIVALVVGTIIAWPRSLQYVASVTLTTSPPDANRYLLVLVTDRVQVAPGPDYGRIIALIQSRTVAERVIQRLDLKITPDVLRSALRVTGGREGQPLLVLSVLNPDPATAIRLANTYADAAVAYNQEANRREAEVAVQFLQERLQDTRARLAQAEDALDNFKQAHGIVSMPAQLNAQIGQYLNLVNQQQAALLNQREISARIADIHRRMSQFSPTNTEQEVTESPVAQKLRGDLVNLQIQLATARLTYTDQHPAVVVLQQRIKILQEVLANEIKKIVSAEFVKVNPVYETLVRSLVDLETQRVAAQATQAAMAAVIPEAERKLPELNAIDREFTRLSRNAQILETSYTATENRLNDFRVQQQVALERAPVYVVDTATSAQPTSPSHTVVGILAAVMLGVIGGIGLVVFQDQIDNTVKNAQDAERLLGAPVLTSVVRHNPPFDEAYRLLKTALGLHGPNGQRPAIMFTGARPGAGTSTVVYHLARAVARGGKRVTVVDANLRRPATHRLFGVAADAGLVEVLTGAVPLQAALQSSTVANVRVLPAGNASPLELADLFATPAMTQLLDELRQDADVILIDSPPPVPFAESRALAAMTDGVVLVLAAGQAPRGVELETKRELERAQARVLGIVVNKVSPENDDTFYLHEKYHGPTPPPSDSPPSKGFLARGRARVRTLLHVPTPRPSGSPPSKGFLARVRARVRTLLLVVALGVGGVAVLLETNLAVAIGVGSATTLEGRLAIYTWLGQFFHALTSTLGGKF